MSNLPDGWRMRNALGQSHGPSLANYQIPATDAGDTVDNDECLDEAVTQESFRLLDLSPELRLRIYDYIMINDVSVSDYKLRTPYRHPILETCKLIRNEARSETITALLIFAAKLQELDRVIEDIGFSTIISMQCYQLCITMLPRCIQHKVMHLVDGGTFHEWSAEKLRTFELVPPLIIRAWNWVDHELHKHRGTKHDGWAGFTRVRDTLMKGTSARRAVMHPL